MDSFTIFINLFWGVLSIIALALVIVLKASIFSKSLAQTALVRWFARNGLLVGFIVSLLAMTGSLIYSEYLHYTPCKLCWYQRIVMYPQVLLLGLAWFKKHSFMKLYGILLSAIGAIIAFYHYLGQIELAHLPCAAVGVSVSCSEKFVMQFGFITIPLMAFAAFALIGTTLYISRKADREATL